MRGTPGRAVRDSAAGAVIAVSSDKAYADQARQVFAGLRDRGGWSGDYLLLSDDMDPADICWFERRGVHVRTARPMFVNDHLPAVTFSRYVLFQEWIRSWRFVIFLDLDIIIRRRIDGILDLGLDRLGAVRGYKSTVRGNFAQEKDPALFRQLDSVYDLSLPAFNAGVMAYPTDIIDAATYTRLCELTARYLPISRFANQGLLNLAFLGNWTELSPEYNAYVPTYLSPAGDLLLPEARIIHFNGPRMKPWDRASATHPRFGGEWLENLAAAGQVSRA